MRFPPRTGDPPNWNAGRKVKPWPGWVYWTWPVVFGVRSLLHVVEWSGGPEVPTAVMIGAAILVAVVYTWRWRVYQRGQAGPASPGLGPGWRR